MNFLDSTKSHGKSGGGLPLFRLQRTPQITAAAPPKLKSNSKPSQSSLDYRPELSAQDKDVKGRLARRAVSVGLSIEINIHAIRWHFETWMPCRRLCVGGSG